jgi:hypothetical protein
LLENLYECWDSREFKRYHQWKNDLIHYLRSFKITAIPALLDKYWKYYFKIKIPEEEIFTFDYSVPQLYYSILPLNSSVCLWNYIGLLVNYMILLVNDIVLLWKCMLQYVNCMFLIGNYLLRLSNFSWIFEVNIGHRSW